MAKKRLVVTLALSIIGLPASAEIIFRNGGCYELRGELVSVTSRVLGIRINRGSRSEETAEVRLSKEASSRLADGPAKGQFVKLHVLVEGRGLLVNTALSSDLSVFEKITGEEALPEFKFISQPAKGKCP